jgi:hypothetical protein
MAISDAYRLFDLDEDGEKTYASIHPVIAVYSLVLMARSCTVE